MSYKFTEQVWNIEGLYSSEKFVLLCFARIADKEGKCWPTISHISEACNIRPRQVTNIIKILIEKGYLERKDRPGKVTIFTIVTPAMDCVGTPAMDCVGTPAMDCVGANIAPLQNPTSTPAKSDIDPCKIRHRPLQNPTSYIDNRSIETMSKEIMSIETRSIGIEATQEKNSGEKKIHGSRFSLNELPEEWMQFCFQKRPDLDPQETFDQFSDYWKSKPGKGALKTDWLRTWRNWVRNQKQNGGYRYEKSNTIDAIEGARRAQSDIFESLDTKFQR